MFIRTAPALLTAAILLPLAACNRDGNQTATATSSADTLGPDTIATASMAPPDAAGAVANTPLPLTAQAFVDAATSSNLYELGAAKLADANTQPAAIRAFAQRMISDHTAALNNLKAAVAKANNPAIVDNQQINPQHQTLLDELHATTPADFARVYARQQVNAHQKTLAILETYAKSGDSKPLMAYAAKTAPIVRSHLEMARKLDQ